MPGCLSFNSILTLKIANFLTSKKNPPAKIQTPLNRPSGCADEYLTVQYQVGLDIIGVGAAGQVYNVDDHTVLKTCRIYEPPSKTATPRALWDYASETVFHSCLLIDERAVLRLLAKRPHPNMIEVIDVDQPDGIYLPSQIPTAVGFRPSISVWPHPLVSGHYPSASSSPYPWHHPFRHTQGQCTI